MNLHRSFLFWIYLLISLQLGWTQFEHSWIWEPESKHEDSITVWTGLDRLARNNFAGLPGSRWGLVVNQTSVDRHGLHIVDLILINNGEIAIIFSPEHGYRGHKAAGEMISDSIDPISGAPIVSLYGSKRKPDPQDLENLDALIFDIQDAGSRYYTYISTLTYLLEAASEINLPVVVLDRPNPLGGVVIRGPLLNTDYRSFVGLHPIPIRHGMTVGELAIMMNESDWLTEGRHAKLLVVPLHGWERQMQWPDTRLAWIPPSPNIPEYETAVLYSGMCLLEGTNVSEGRGTTTPFLLCGAPWLDGDELVNRLNPNSLKGVVLTSVEYTPVSIPGMATYPKYENERCGGVQIRLSDPLIVDPLQISLNILLEIRRIWPDKFEVLPSQFIDNLYGGSELRQFLENPVDEDSLDIHWHADERQFADQRKPFLLYP